MTLGKKFFFYALIGVSIIITTFSYGCTGLIGNAVIANLPTYQETIEVWSRIESGKGRALFYYIKQEGSGIIGPSVASIKIDDDRKLRASFSDRTFVFADLAVGSHFVEIKCAPFRTCKNIDIQIKKGEILYIKVDNDSEHFQSFQVVDNTIALKDLESMHHNFKKPLSIYYQPKPL